MLPTPYIGDAADLSTAVPALSSDSVATMGTTAILEEASTSRTVENNTLEIDLSQNFTQKNISGSRETPDTSKGEKINGKPLVLLKKCAKSLLADTDSLPSNCISQKGRQCRRIKQKTSCGASCANTDCYTSDYSTRRRSTTLHQRNKNTSVSASPFRSQSQKRNEVVQTAQSQIEDIARLDIDWVSEEVQTTLDGNGPAREMSLFIEPTPSNKDCEDASAKKRTGKNGGRRKQEMELRAENTPDFLGSSSDFTDTDCIAVASNGMGSRNSKRNKVFPSSGNSGAAFTVIDLSLSPSQDENQTTQVQETAQLPEQTKNVLNSSRCGRKQRGCTYEFENNPASKNTSRTLCDKPENILTNITNYSGTPINGQMGLVKPVQNKFLGGQRRPTETEDRDILGGVLYSKETGAGNLVPELYLKIHDFPNIPSESTRCDIEGIYPTHTEGYEPNRLSLGIPQRETNSTTCETSNSFQSLSNMSDISKKIQDSGCEIEGENSEESSKFVTIGESNDVSPLQNNSTVQSPDNDIQILDTTMSDVMSPLRVSEEDDDEKPTLQDASELGHICTKSSNSAADTNLKLSLVEMNMRNKAIVVPRPTNTGLFCETQKSVEKIFSKNSSVSVSTSHLNQYTPNNNVRSSHLSFRGGESSKKWLHSPTDRISEIRPPTCISAKKLPGLGTERFCDVTTKGTSAELSKQIDSSKLSNLSDLKQQIFGSSDVKSGTRSTLSMLDDNDIHINQNGFEITLSKITPEAIASRKKASVNFNQSVQKIIGQTTAFENQRYDSGNTQLNKIPARLSTFNQKRRRIENSPPQIKSIAKLLNANQAEVMKDIKRAEYVHAFGTDRETFKNVATPTQFRDTVLVVQPGVATMRQDKSIQAEELLKPQVTSHKGRRKVDRIRTENLLKSWTTPREVTRKVDIVIPKHLPAVGSSKFGTTKTNEMGRNELEATSISVPNYGNISDTITIEPFAPLPKTRSVEFICPDNFQQTRLNEHGTFNNSTNCARNTKGVTRIIINSVPPMNKPVHIANHSVNLPSTKISMPSRDAVLSQVLKATTFTDNQQNSHLKPINNMLLPDMKYANTLPTRSLPSVNISQERIPNFDRFASNTKYSVTLPGQIHRTEINASNDHNSTWNIKETQKQQYSASDGIPTLKENSVGRRARTGTPNSTAQMSVPITTSQTSIGSRTKTPIPVRTVQLFPSDTHAVPVAPPTSVATVQHIPCPRFTTFVPVPIATGVSVKPVVPAGSASNTLQSARSVPLNKTVHNSTANNSMTSIGNQSIAAVGIDVGRNCLDKSKYTDTCSLSSPSLSTTISQPSISKKSCGTSIIVPTGTTGSNSRLMAKSDSVLSSTVTENSYINLPNVSISTLTAKSDSVSTNTENSSIIVPNVSIHKCIADSVLSSTVTENSSIDLPNAKSDSLLSSTLTLSSSTVVPNVTIHKCTAESGSISSSTGTDNSSIRVPNVSVFGFTAKSDNISSNIATENSFVDLPNAKSVSILTSTENSSNVFPNVLVSGITAKSGSISPNVVTENSSNVLQNKLESGLSVKSESVSSTSETHNSSIIVPSSTTTQSSFVIEPDVPISALNEEFDNIVRNTGIRISPNVERSTVATDSSLTLSEAQADVYQPNNSSALLPAEGEPAISVDCQSSAEADSSTIPVDLRDLFIGNSPLHGDREADILAYLGETDASFYTDMLSDMFLNNLDTPVVGAEEEVVSSDASVEQETATLPSFAAVVLAEKVAGGEAQNTESVIRAELEEFIMFPSPLSDKKKPRSRNKKNVNASGANTHDATSSRKSNKRKLDDVIAEEMEKTGSSVAKGLCAAHRQQPTTDATAATTQASLATQLGIMREFQQRMIRCMQAMDAEAGVADTGGALTDC